MNNKKEYNEFMQKLVTKALEVDKDFNDLSPETQAQVSGEMNQLINALLITREAAVINDFKNRFIK